MCNVKFISQKKTFLNLVKLLDKKNVTDGLSWKVENGCSQRNEWPWRKKLCKAFSSSNSLPNNEVVVEVSIIGDELLPSIDFPSHVIPTFFQYKCCLIIIKFFVALKNLQ